jgi:cobalt-zinc-cadmium efflux system protein
MPAASAHVLVQPRQDCHAVRADLEELLAREYGITHLTLQVDHLPDTASAAATATATAEAAAGRPGPLPEQDADDHHRADEARDSHCEDSHGPAYRPSRDR